MLHMQTISKVRLLFHKKKLSQREIAKRLNLNRRTVTKYLEVTEPPTYQRTNKHFSKLAPFVEQLEQRLQEEQLLPKHQRLSVLRHYEWLKAKGFNGRRFERQVAELIREVILNQFKLLGRPHTIRIS